MRGAGFYVTLLNVVVAVVVVVVVVVVVATDRYRSFLKCPVQACYLRII